MSISSVNPYMSMLAAYKTATADNKQSNTPLDTVENTQAKATTRPGDTVTISEEAVAANNKFNFQEKAEAIFSDWKQAGAPVFPGIKPIDALLPESQGFIYRLQEEQKNSEPERKVEIENHMAFVRAYGDKEPFVNKESIFNMQKILGEVTRLASKDMVQNPENWNNITRFNGPVDKYALAGQR